MKAKDLMTRDVVTLDPLTDAVEAARLLSERKITGAPVVDARGNLLGVVSQTDLVRLEAEESMAGWEDEGGRMRRPVLCVMTDRPLSCDEETPIEDVVRVMLERRVHRLLVTREGKLSGIITAMDLLRAVPGAHA